MDIKKIVPWNWVKKEQEQEGRSLPAHRTAPQSGYTHPIAQIHNEINRLFDNMFRGFGFPEMDLYSDLSPVGSGDWIKPTLDVGASDKEYSINVELPGVEEKDIQLELVNDTLKIFGEKKKEKEEKDKNFYRMERSYGSFQRMLSLPEDADRENIHATYKNGIMTISIPRKALPQTESKRIEIKAA